MTKCDCGKDLLGNKRGCHAEKAFIVNSVNALFKETNQLFCVCILAAALKSPYFAHLFRMPKLFPPMTCQNGKKQQASICFLLR